MPSDAALRIEALSHRFGKREVLHALDLVVQPGDFTILLGLNGAGKSTLFALITMLHHATAGRIAVFGHDIRREPLAALRRLGVVFQQSTLDMDLTVQQNLAYQAALRGLAGAEAQARIVHGLEQVGLAERRRDSMRALSGGQRRRVELVRALLDRPSLLLLDEPTTGLDFESRRFLLEHVQALCGAGTMGVLWATHLIDETNFATNVAVLHKGRMLIDAPRAEVLRQAGSQTMSAAFEQLTAAA